jgi:hypothetical protein
MNDEGEQASGETLDSGMNSPEAIDNDGDEKEREPAHNISTSTKEAKDTNRPDGKLPKTGIKFYDRNGNLLYNTDRNGYKNQIFVISKDKMDQYNSYVTEDTRELHDHEYFEDVANLFGKEYKIMKSGIKEDHLYVYMKRDIKTIFLSSIHFAAEGFGAGYGGGRAFRHGYIGLHHHYQNLKSPAKNYWLNKLEVKPFKAWWQKESSKN